VPADLHEGDEALTAGTAPLGAAAEATELPKPRSLRVRPKNSSINLYKDRPFVVVREPLAPVITKKRPPPGRADGSRRGGEDGPRDEQADAQLEAWRHQIAGSALRFARVCDIPHSMLRNCGAFGLG